MQTFKKIDALEVIGGIVTLIVEAPCEFTAPDIIGNVIMVDDEAYCCIAIERFDLETTNESVIWAGEKLKVFVTPVNAYLYQADDGDDGDDFW